MPRLKTIEKSDLYVGDDIRLVNDAKGDYPYGLEPDQVVRLIYFFGARKLASKALGAGGSSRTAEFTAMEKAAMKKFFGWFGLQVSDPEEFKKAYKVVIIRFKQILDFLRHRPAFITRDIYQACKFSNYERVVKSVVFVVDKNRNIVPRSTGSDNDKHPIPIAQAEGMMWNIQNIALDKMLFILQSISPKDIKGANLGSKSKALRDIYAMYHMSKLGNKNPNMTLINLNLGSAEPSQKMTSYTNYVQRNRGS